MFPHAILPPARAVRPAPRQSGMAMLQFHAKRGDRVLHICPPDVPEPHPSGALAAGPLPLFLLVAPPVSPPPDPLCSGVRPSARGRQGASRPLLAPTFVFLPKRRRHGASTDPGARHSRRRDRGLTSGRCADLALPGAAAASSPAPLRHLASGPLPTITQIPAGACSHGYPYDAVPTKASFPGAPTINLAHFGYVEREFKMSGTTNVYQQSGFWGLQRRVERVGGTAQRPLHHAPAGAIPDEPGEVQRDRGGGAAE